MTAIMVNLSTLNPLSIDGVYRTVDGIDELRQKIAILFKSVSNDYFNDLGAGLNLEILLSDRVTRETYLRAILISFEGVNAITELVTEVTNSTRVLNLDFTLATDFGPSSFSISGDEISFPDVGGNPTPAFSISGGSSMTVAVDASLSYDPAGVVTGYTWAWGDGSVSTGITASHEYLTEGSWTVTLTLEDGAGGSWSTSKPYDSIIPNDPPVAAFTGSASGFVYTVDASASSDSDGTIASYIWDWGDGVQTTTSIATYDYNYSAAGTYTPTLIVVDNDGTSSSVFTAAAVTITGAVTIPEPGTALTYWDVFRLFEEPSGPLSSFTNTGASGLTSSAAGAARPTGTGNSVLWDGVANEMAVGSASDFNWMHVPGGADDWTIQFIFKADPSFATGTHRLFATVGGPGARGIYIQAASGTLRIYGYKSTAGDNSVIPVVWDGSWQAITLRFDTNRKDLYKSVNSVIDIKDSNWAFVPEAGDSQHPLTIGSGIGAHFSALECRDFRTAKTFGTRADAVEYVIWANLWGLLDP